MTTGQQDSGVPSQTEAPSGPGNCYCGGPEEAVYGHPYGSGYYCRRKTAASQVDAGRAAEAPPLAELVTDEDLVAAREAGARSVSAGPVTPRGGWDAVLLRAALEAYGARLLARHGRTP